MNTIMSLTLASALSMTAAPPPEPHEIMAVPPGTLERLEVRIGRLARSPERRLDLLIDFISQESGLNLTYRSVPTLDISATINEGRGNCLSFTLLFISLARALGLDVHAREVDLPPEWSTSSADGLIFRIGHVNVGVTTPSRHATVDFEPDPMLSRRLAAPWRGRPISDERALAHFYNNRAAELISENRLTLADQWVVRAIELDPGFAAAWNTRGVIARRLEQFETARAAFVQALDLQPGDASILFNLIGIELQLGQEASASRYSARLESLHPNDPYFHWTVGRHHERLGQHLRAARLYRLAIAQMPDEQRFHASLARVLFETGDLQGAQDALAASRTPNDFVNQQLHTKLQAHKPAL